MKLLIPALLFSVSTIAAAHADSAPYCHSKIAASVDQAIVRLAQSKTQSPKALRTLLGGVVAKSGWIIAPNPISKVDSLDIADVTAQYSIADGKCEGTTLYDVRATVYLKEKTCDIVKVDLTESLNDDCD